MTKTIARNDLEKEFADTFRRLANVHSGWQVWSDFVHCTAYAISNAVDSVHREQREKDYMRIMSQYQEAERQAIAHLFALTTAALEQNPDQDFLGSLYMRLDMGNQNLGQCFTPYDVCRMMASMNCPDLPREVEKKGWVSVMDCCIGGGAMLIAFASECLAQKVNFQNHCLFVGQDIDHTVAMMAYIQLSLLGCPGYIVVGDALTEPLAGDTLFAPMDRETFVMPMYCSEVWRLRRQWHLVDRISRNCEQLVNSPELVNPHKKEENPEPAPAIQVKSMSRKELKQAQISMFWDGM